MNNNQQPAVRNILCGLTVGDDMIAAGRWANHAATGLHAALDIVGVYGRANVEMRPDEADALKQSTESTLDSWLATNGIHCNRARTVEGSLADVLLDESRAMNPGIVVIGSHEVEGATALGFGSVARTLAHHLRSPVVSVPNGGRKVVGGAFVVGIDGSDFSRLALSWTSALARSLHGSCCAVYCIDDLYETFNSGDWYGREEREARAFDSSAGFDVEFVERPGPNPAETLEEVANEREAALVVVAAKQRRGLGGLLLGAVPDRLLHHPDLPVGVLPHDFLEQYRPATDSSAHPGAIS